MDTEDLITFPESDAPVYNYFTNEKELLETKQKVKELEDKLKQFEVRIKKVKEPEDRLLKLQTKKVKELEDKVKDFESRMTENSGFSIFPMLDKSNAGHESLRFYNIKAETIKINSVCKLFIDDQLFSSVSEFTKNGYAEGIAFEFLKQFKNVKYLIIEFIPQYNQENISMSRDLFNKLITNICHTIIKNNNCEIIFNADSLHGINSKETETLFTTCFNSAIYKKITIDIRNNLNVVGGQGSYASADFITQTKKHCDKNNIEFKSNLGL